MTVAPISPPMPRTTRQTVEMASQRGSRRRCSIATAWSRATAIMAATSASAMASRVWSTA
jgi:hypothetical protein